jgi:hypothetical protein
MGTSGSFCGHRAKARTHLPLLLKLNKYAWSNISTPAYIIMAWQLSKGPTLLLPHILNYRKCIQKSGHKYPQE